MSDFDTYIKIISPLITPHNHNSNNYLSFPHTILLQVYQLFLVFKMNRLILFVATALFLQGALGELVCEDLPTGMCSFSIASSGKRCLLETFETRDGQREFQCKTSEVVAINMRGHVEDDECVRACGVDRNSVGISSDSLLEAHFTRNLCSPKCYYNCPNIIDLYQSLALAEGVRLPELCKFQIANSRRSVMQLQSSGAAASGPVSGAAGPASDAAYAPVSSTAFSSVDCAPAPM